MTGNREFYLEILKILNIEKQVSDDEQQQKANHQELRKKIYW